MDEFVVGFTKDDPEGLTPIDVVMDITGLTYEEVLSCRKVITLPEQEGELDEEPDFEPCSECDGHDACADFGCAIKAGLGHMLQKPL